MTSSSRSGSGVIVIGGYVFDGPVYSPLELRDTPGVYVTLDVTGSVYRIIDFGEPSAVRSRLTDHDRKVCWAQKTKGTLRVAVRYTTPEQPM